ncbi:hypothetical protein ACY05_01745 [Sterolibacterium denitrificans]|uniref:Flagellar protein FlaG n=1 Tax=Sterolibacterium denitrificans TaxID=157592 RepID=A0A656ZCZ6_9PROT|nr:hypothetical protein ACY05_01745 [Sterolibacterium denitrificans]
MTVAAPPVGTPSAAPAPAPAQAAPAASLAAVEEATRQVAELVQSRASNLVFSLDDDSGKTIVKIVDAQTDEVIRQIPSEEMLALAKSIEEYQNAQSVLIKDSA